MIKNYMDDIQQKEGEKFQPGRKYLEIYCTHQSPLTFFKINFYSDEIFSLIFKFID